MNCPGAPEDQRGEDEHRDCGSSKSDRDSRTGFIYKCKRNRLKQIFLHWKTKQVKTDILHKKKQTESTFV